MVWTAHLALHYRRDGGRTVAHDRHEGPLRVLQALYPEGEAICHHVVVHPPGGIVGGDVLATDLHATAGTHALVTTPGAAKFYRSAGPQAVQRAHLRVDDGARLEWLPLETIAYRGCHARNDVRLDLAPGAQMIGWDVLALGLPAGGEAFDHGRFTQQLHWPGVWLDQGTVDGEDQRLLDSPLGWAGHRVLATAWVAAGTAWPAEQREALLDAARSSPATAGLAIGATAPDPRLVLLRVLAPRVEPAMQLLQAVRAAWRQIAWSLAPHPPRIWRT
ncbi:MAG: urease accessory protein UreD [Burkholderiaceae bacterium]|nr:urease accessory protein UreD [Burkholderiaceae bacterium]